MGVAEALRDTREEKVSVINKQQGGVEEERVMFLTVQADTQS